MGLGVIASLVECELRQPYHYEQISHTSLLTPLKIFPLTSAQDIRQGLFLHPILHEFHALDLLRASLIRLYVSQGETTAEWGEEEK